jgi:hypothetical protein
MPSLHARHLNEAAPVAARPPVSEWLWRRWYAKLWWSAIPVWWIGMAAAGASEPLARFYDGALAGFLNLLFFPMTALLVLGVGFVRHWIDGFVDSRTGGSADSTEIAAAEDEYVRAFEDLNATIDIYDPRSGGLYIGNPLSFQHPDRT